MRPFAAKIITTILVINIFFHPNTEVYSENSTSHIIKGSIGENVETQACKALKKRMVDHYDMYRKCAVSVNGMTLKRVHCVGNLDEVV